MSRWVLALLGFVLVGGALWLLHAWGLESHLTKLPGLARKASEAIEGTDEDG